MSTSPDLDRLLRACRALLDDYESLEGHIICEWEDFAEMSKAYDTLRFKLDREQAKAAKGDR